MKNLILRFLNKKTEVNLWLLYHLSIPLLLLLSVIFFGSVGVKTNLFDMMPQSSQEKSIRKADMVLSEKNGREAVILCASSDFEKAKEAAVLLYDAFKDSKGIESINLFYDSTVYDEFYKYLFKYRFVIASNETLDLLENDLEQEIAYDALSGVYSAFTFFPLTYLDKDPFLLAERRIKDIFSSNMLTGAMNLKDDVIAAEKDGINYVLLRMTLTKEAASIEASKNAIGNIYSQAASIKKEIEGIEYYFSGIPFHSYESSSGAQKEISLISSITLILILMLFIFVFKSPSPVIASVCAIFVSIAMAACAALLIFREIHIITFVFGTTLIGTCVDYSAHFFINWKKNTEMQDGEKIRSHIIKNITMSFISTQICFIVFLFAPFPILKQFAVFSITGLLSSYLTFYCIYPRMKLPVEKENIKMKINKNHKKVYWLKYIKPIFSICFIVSIILLFLFNFSNIKIKNDISSLYKISDFMMESEKRAAQVLDYGSSGWYFIVSGSTINEALVNEEKLRRRLQDEVIKGNLSSYFAASVFVPSQEKQAKTYNSMRKLLPLTEEHFINLGFPSIAAKDYEKEFNESFVICLPEDAPSQFGISNLWIGEIDGTYYSCVMPIKPKEEIIFKSIANEFKNVHFINKAKDISESLDKITKTMLVLFLIAYIIVSVIIFLSFPVKESIKICSVPLLLIVTTAAILAVLNIPIGFFSISALVLVFGLSLDYIFFMANIKNKKERKITFMGVALSFLTTLLSFGALALSGFMPVHLFGLTVCAGLGTAFISAIILQSRVNEEGESQTI